MIARTVVICLLLPLVVLPGTLAAPARLSPVDTPIVTIESPWSDGFAGAELKVSVRIRSSDPIEFAAASVAGRLTHLDNSYSCYYGDQCRDGTLDLDGLARGPHELLVKVRDAAGHWGEARRTIIYDQKPRLVVHDPPYATVARPGVRLSATCTDDDPTGCVVSVRFWGESVSGAGSVNEYVSLARRDGQIVFFEFWATDSAGQTTSEQRMVFVETNPYLVEPIMFAGAIMDVTPAKVLHLDDWSAGNQLFLHDRATGQDVAIPVPQSLGWIAAAFVTPNGAILRAGGIWEWRDGALARVSSSDAAESLLVRGGYALWDEDRTLILRDLVAGRNTVIATDLFAAGWDLTEQGVVVWASDWRLYRYQDGRSDFLAQPAGIPKTGGDDILYVRPGSQIGEPPLSLVLLAGGAPLSLGQYSRPMSGQPYAINDGWVALTTTTKPYADLGEVRRRSPGGQWEQLSSLGSIGALATNGDFVFMSDGRRYFVGAAPGSSPVDIGSNFGAGSDSPVFRHGDKWELALRRTLFRIDLSRNPVRVWLPFTGGAP